MVFRGDLKEIPLKKIGSLVIHSSVQITSQAIAALSENGCSISWVNGVDKLICSTDCDNIGHVQRRKHQYRLTDNMRFRLSISNTNSQSTYRQTLGYNKFIPRQAPLPGDSLSAVAFLD